MGTVKKIMESAATMAPAPLTGLQELEVLQGRLSRHLRVSSWQRRTPTVEGDWPARAVVTSTASPLRSSSLLLRRPRRLPPPRPSSPLPKLKYNLGRRTFL